MSIRIKVGAENVKEGIDMRDIRKAELTVIYNNTDVAGTVMDET